MSKSMPGFTLLELLVVIAVLGVLATIPLIVLSGSTAKARDSVRRSDLKQYQLSLEVFANNHSGYYPSRNILEGKPPSVFCVDLGITNCQDDPKGTPSYLYQTNGSGWGNIDATQYVLWAQLENPPTPTTWVVVCSDGQSGETSSGIPPVGGVCPL